MNGDSRVEKMWIHFILEQCGTAWFAGSERTLVHHTLTYYIKINIIEVRCLNKYDISVLLFSLLSSVYPLNEQKNT